MEYLKVTVETVSDYAELLADALAHITGGCEISDPKNIELLYSKDSPRWDYIDEGLTCPQDGPVTVNFYLVADDEGAGIFKAACDKIAHIKAEDTLGFCGSLKVEIAPMENQNWETSWRDYFKAFRVGKRLIVRPSWEAADTDTEKIVLTIDPAASFGTGNHATTRMCMEALERTLCGGERVLDIGCGSGILACAAILLGAGSAVCCDIEATAMKTVAQNMQLNAIGGDKYITVHGDILADRDCAEKVRSFGSYNIILANIVADVLIPMAPILRGMLAESGRIIMSGIIESRRGEVLAAAGAAGLELRGETASEGWVALLLE